MKKMTRAERERLRERRAIMDLSAELRGNPELSVEEAKANIAAREAELKRIEQLHQNGSLSKAIKRTVKSAVPVADMTRIEKMKAKSGLIGRGKYTPDADGGVKLTDVAVLSHEIKRCVESNGLSAPEPTTEECIEDMEGREFKYSNTISRHMDNGGIASTTRYTKGKLREGKDAWRIMKAMGPEEVVEFPIETMCSVRVMVSNLNKMYGLGLRSNTRLNPGKITVIRRCNEQGEA